MDWEKIIKIFYDTLSDINSFDSIFDLKNTVPQWFIFVICAFICLIKILIIFLKWWWVDLSFMYGIIKYVLASLDIYTYWENLIILLWDLLEIDDINSISDLKNKVLFYLIWSFLYLNKAQTIIFEILIEWCLLPSKTIHALANTHVDWKLVIWTLCDFLDIDYDSIIKLSKTVSKRLFFLIFAFWCLGKILYIAIYVLLMDIIIRFPFAIADLIEAHFDMRPNHDQPFRIFWALLTLVLANRIFFWDVFVNREKYDKEDRNQRITYIILTNVLAIVVLIVQYVFFD